MQYWLVKTEPDVYSFEQLTAEKTTAWDGVRNYAARNHLQSMKKGDTAIVYHTGDERCAVGLATVVKEAYPDPTADNDAWVCVDLKAGKALKKPVSLDSIKADDILCNSLLVRIGRLSVVPLTQEEYARFLMLAGM